MANRDTIIRDFQGANDWAGKATALEKTKRDELKDICENLGIKMTAFEKTRMSRSDMTTKIKEELLGSN